MSNSPRRIGSLLGLGGIVVPSGTSFAKTCGYAAVAGAAWGTTMAIVVFILTITAIHFGIIK
jgi:hypothetical protein